MADLKITQLSADTAPTTDDLVTTVNDPGGTPANRKVTVANFMTQGNMKNPYKFSVYRHAAWTSANGSLGKVTFDTEEFDTGSNFASGTFTAPVAGFYQFNASVQASVSAGYAVVSLFKNGAEFKRGGQENGTFVAGCDIACMIQLAANDTVDIYFQGTGGAGSVDVNTWFSGFLVSIT